MDKFIVSARKYRPVTFDTVVGQPGITNTLTNAIRNNHLAQAFLFTGPRGVGKTTTARILAKTINCKNLTAKIEACDQCECCIAFNQGYSLNIYEMDAASNNSVDDIRALVDQVRYAPQIGKYKVYIIDEVHMLSPNAFNAFLKTLEEPPSYAIFILATTEKHKIIPTILSRCQIFDFNRITVDDITAHLKMIAVKEGVDAEEDALHIIAQKADGALRDALSLFDQQVSFSGNKLRYQDVIANLNILDYDYYFRMVDDLYAGNLSAVLLTFNEILSNGFDGHHFLTGLASHCRDVLVCKDEQTLPLLEVSPNIREKYKFQSRLCSSGWLMEALEVLNQADINYRAAKNQRLLVELALIKICSSVNSSSPNLAGMDQIKKKTEPVRSSLPVEKLITPSAPLPVSIPVSPAAVVPPPAEIKKSSPIEPAKATTAPPGTKKSISISNSLKTPAETIADPAKPKLTPDLSNAFTQEELRKAWKGFAELLQHEGRLTLHTALLKNNPVLDENFLIRFIVDNATVEKDLNDIKSDLLSYLRQNLSNYNIRLETKIQVQDPNSQTPYTPSEKFKKLAEKNPLLNDLKKNFDLEIEY